MIKDNIKSLCSEQHRSITQVERSAGISKGYIHNLENPTLDVLRRIARALGVTVCELIQE